MTAIAVSEKSLALAQRLVHQLFKDNRRHGLSGIHEYNVYTDAKNRCNCPSDKDYRNYGGRGLTFDFTSFNDFFDEIGPRPTSEHVLDRINNDLGYRKGNVRWTTRSVSNANKRHPKRTVNATEEK